MCIRVNNIQRVLITVWIEFQMVFRLKLALFWIKQDANFYLQTHSFGQRGHYLIKYVICLCNLALYQMSSQVRNQTVYAIIGK